LGYALTDVDIRSLTASDRELVATFFSGLSPRTLYNRFCGPKPHLSERDLDVLAAVDGHSHVAFVALDAESKPVAMGRFVRVVGDEQAGEVAITVADDWQNRGLGSLLARLLARRALQAGMSRFHATVLSENRPALAILRKLGRPSVVDHAGAALDLEVRLGPLGYDDIAAWAPTLQAGAMPRFS
jgi:RimJ/RimL family protein N-acetyltransferase